MKPTLNTFLGQPAGKKKPWWYYVAVILVYATALLTLFRWFTPFEWQRHWATHLVALWIFVAGCIVLLHTLLTTLLGFKYPKWVFNTAVGAAIVTIFVGGIYSHYSKNSSQSKQTTKSKNISGKGSTPTTTKVEEEDAGPTAVILTDTATQRKATEAVEVCAENAKLAVRALDSLKGIVKTRENTIAQLRTQADANSGVAAASPAEFSKKMDVFISEMKLSNASLEKLIATTDLVANTFATNTLTPSNERPKNLETKKRKDDKKNSNGCSSVKKQKSYPLIAGWAN
jgi:hypothetical protein